MPLLVTIPKSPKARRSRNANIMTQRFLSTWRTCRRLKTNPCSITMKIVSQRKWEARTYAMPTSIRVSSKKLTHKSTKVTALACGVSDRCRVSMRFSTTTRSRLWTCSLTIKRRFTSSMLGVGLMLLSAHRKATLSRMPAWLRFEVYMGQLS